MEEYNKKITQEQKLAIQGERSRLKDLDEKRAKKLELKNRLTELGRPKKALSAFVLFHIDESKKSKTTAINNKVKYDALSEAQKSIYKQKAATLREEYK